MKKSPHIGLRPAAPAIAVPTYAFPNYAVPVFTAMMFTILVLTGWAVPLAAQTQDSTSGYVIRHEQSIGQTMPGPHNGKGMTTGYIFFDDIASYPISFRKRVLHPGSSIGKHKQAEDEVYYVVSGKGTMFINDIPHPLKPGDAVLTKTGSTHETIPEGTDDLVLIIAYQKH